MADGDRKAPRRRLKALGLVSGGLDSTLAARVLQEQGIDVEGVHFSTGFCKIDHRRALRRERDRARPARLRHPALGTGAEIEAPVEIVDVAQEYFREVVLRPKHGYGSAMNPCIDCRIFMLRKAKEIARLRGADVVFTGEVVGQRPMSQYRSALDLVEKESGLQGDLLRPLSARHLSPSKAERDGRIDRERLESIHGRSRRGQRDLAERLGMEVQPTPSGGCCYLADENFARRLRDLLAHRRPEDVRVEELILLKVGRHLRLSHDLKVVVGRDEAESRFLRGRAGGRWSAQVADGRGTFALVDGEPRENGLARVAAVAARYSRHRDSDRVEVRLQRDDDEQTLSVEPASDEWLRPRLI